MFVELGTLLVAVVAFLAVTFAVAEAAERRVIPESIAEHPLVFALALGVYATSWTFYGSVGFARTEGLGFLAIYVGPTLACLAIPVLWRPLLDLVRRRQLGSLADVLAFRYQSQTAGVLVTLVMLAGSLPYLALQVRAFASSMAFLAGSSSPATGLFFCVAMSAFAVLFGARHATTSARHPGLLAAMALESLVKLAALSAVALFAFFEVHGGDLDGWLAGHPEALRALLEPVASGPWVTLLLLSFSAAFLLPRQFHVAFTECPSDHALVRASWAFPLLLFLLNLGIPVILWAGERIAPDTDPDLYVLAVSAERPWLATLAFLGGVSAVSGMIVVTSLALATMALNHLVLPLWQPRGDVYRSITWARRALTVLTILGGYLVFRGLSQVGKLVDLGLVAFVSVAQVLPGLFGVFFWRGATGTGAVLGLATGTLTWAATLLWPMLAKAEIASPAPDLAGALGLGGLDPWTASTALSLAANGLLFALGSLATSPRPAEIEAAAACLGEDLEGGLVDRTTAGELVARLEPALGREAARSEVERALNHLGLEREETRPAMLGRVRDRVETNLSGLFGPVLARAVLGRLTSGDEPALADRVRFLEARLESDEARLRGLARDVDEVRRYLHRVLEDLPVGVCAIGPANDVVVWNAELARITGLEAERMIGERLLGLPEPWGELLRERAATLDACFTERSVGSRGAGRVLRLGQSRLDERSEERRVRNPAPGGDRQVKLDERSEERRVRNPAPGGDRQVRLDAPAGGAVLLVEDLTERRTLEASVAHQDRLASIGRLAAGVAHEIGNPLTGILMLARRISRPGDPPEEVRETARLIEQEGQRIHHIVSALVKFSRGGSAAPKDLRDEPVVLRQVIDDAVGLVRLSRGSRGVELTSACPAAIVVRGDRQRLAQVFVNLLANACDASRAESEVHVAVTQSADGRVVADVIDEGEGIPAEIRDRIFEPFFTTKDPGQGTGLGLSVVYTIVHEHGGRVDVLASEPGKGTTIRVELPGEVEPTSPGLPNSSGA